MRTPTVSVQSETCPQKQLRTVSFQIFKIFLKIILDGFFSQTAWKEELQELLNEIHGDDKKAYAEATIF